MLRGAVKITKDPDGVLAGAAGSAGYNGAFLRWAVGKRRRRNLPTATRSDDGMDRGVLFYPDGSVEIFEDVGSICIRPRYYAFGSGKAEALGAMFAGASAADAVRAAIEHDADTGGDVTVLRHE
jgi:hypothetical protein